MSVIAKFKVENINTFAEGNGIGGQTISMKAVIGDSPENKSWSKYTPNGTLQISITNPDAFNQFEAGKDYYLTFNPVV